MDGVYAGIAGGSRVSAVPLLHNTPLDFQNPAQLRRGLHDLSNTLTGLLGNLELAGMCAEDGELDAASLSTALDGARQAVLAIRELKQQFDQFHPPERT